MPIPNNYYQPAPPQANPIHAISVLKHQGELAMEKEQGQDSGGSNIMGQFLRGKISAYSIGIMLMTSLGLPFSFGNYQRAIYSLTRIKAQSQANMETAAMHGTPISTFLNGHSVGIERVIQAIKVATQIEHR